jgi:hypothetical protein
MRKGIYIKVTEVDQYIINFDIFNLEWNLVGNIKVTFDGDLSRQIWDDVRYSWYVSDFVGLCDLKRKNEIESFVQEISENTKHSQYQEYVLDIVKDILGKDTDRSLNYEEQAKIIDENRYLRAKEYIEKHGLYVNYPQDYWDKEYHPDEHYKKIMQERLSLDYNDLPKDIKKRLTKRQDI